MKKNISILIAFIILTSNLGLSFSLHYCHEKLASISILTASKKESTEHVDACCAKIKKEKECCSETTFKVLKKSDTAVVDDYKFQLLDYSFLENSRLNFVNLVVYNKKNFSSFYCDSNAPPYYKLYCQLIYYA